jgi:hypothetical protein
MSELLKSNECGDWLLAEIAQTRAKSKSADPDVALAARLRLENLQTGKKILLEFLKLQQKMMDAARAARAPRSKAQSSAGYTQTSDRSMH